jgi:hypothetical protein
MHWLPFRIFQGNQPALSSTTHCYLLRIHSTDLPGRKTALGHNTQCA